MHTTRPEKKNKYDIILKERERERVPVSLSLNVNFEISVNGKISDSLLL